MRSLLKLKDTSILASMGNSVMEKICELPEVKGARTIFSYWSLPSEAPTQILNNKLSEKNKVLLPVIDGNNLYLSEYTQGNEMMTDNVYSIPEPTGEPFKAYNSIDVAIIPGLAFSESGLRCGKGKGYYDKTLEQMPSVYKIGLCFSFQLVDNIPVDSHDITMDKVIVI